MPISYAAVAGVNVIGAPLGHDLYVESTDLLSIDVLNIKGLDVMSDIVIRYLDWLED